MASFTKHQFRSQTQVHNKDAFFTTELLESCSEISTENIQIEPKRRRSRWHRWFCRGKEEIHHQNTKDAEKQLHLNEMSPKRLSEEANDSKVKGKKHRTIRQRLFGHKKENSAQPFQLSSVLDVNETLTQRYMNSNYDKLMEDVDAIPFSLRVEEPTTIRSRVSKLFSLWSLSRSNKQYLDSSSHFTHFDGTEDEEWNPYNVAKNQSSQNLKFSTETFPCSANRIGIDRSSRFGSIRKRIYQVISCQTKSYNPEGESDGEKSEEENLSEIDEQSQTVLIHPQSQIPTSTTLFIQDIFQSTAVVNSKFESIKTLESDRIYSGSTEVSKTSEEQTMFKASDGYPRENESNVFKRPERATSIILKSKVKRIDTPVIKSKSADHSESNISKDAPKIDYSCLLSLLSEYSINSADSGTRYESQDESYFGVISKIEADASHKAPQSSTVRLARHQLQFSSGPQDLEQREGDSKQIEELREMIRQNREHHNRIVKCLPVAK